LSEWFRLAWQAGSTAGGGSGSALGIVLDGLKDLLDAHAMSEIRIDEAGFDAFMIDTLRRVSEHVTIGHANKHGKDMSAWFILCRDAE
jgi:hypothetical protein